MRPITLYVKSGCPYSAGAKRLFEEKGLTFEEINVTDHPERLEEMLQRSAGSKTFPQAFFGDEHIGGFDELQEIDRTEGIKARLIDTKSIPESQHRSS